MQVKFTKSIKETGDIYTFFFVAQNIPNFVAGQFVEVSLPHDNPDDRGTRRWFTLSSSPTEDELAISMKINHQCSSFKKAILQLKPGNQISIYNPMGDFVLPKSPDIPLLFISAGIGSTPFRSIIKSLIDTNQTRDITLVHIAGSSQQIAFEDIFKTLGSKFVPIITKKVDPKKLLEQVNISPDHYIYISGPEKVVELVSDQLKANGHDSSQIYTDFFPGYN